MREFHLGDILSVTTGYLLSPTHMSGVYEILNYMTGESLFTHQLPRAREACKGPLLAQHPQLAEIDLAHLAPAARQDHLTSLVECYGEHLPVAALFEGEYEPRDPFVELTELTDRPIMVTVLPE